jgi:hypothetical protein
MRPLPRRGGPSRSHWPGYAPTPLVSLTGFAADFVSARSYKDEAAASVSAASRRSAAPTRSAASCAGRSSKGARPDDTAGGRQGSPSSGRHRLLRHRRQPWPLGRLGRPALRLQLRDLHSRHRQRGPQTRRSRNMAPRCAAFRAITTTACARPRRLPTSRAGSSSPTPPIRAILEIPKRRHAGLRTHGRRGARRGPSRSRRPMFSCRPASAAWPRPLPRQAGGASALNRPMVVLGDPLKAGCWLESFRAGEPTAVEGDLDTLMAGLACGEVSLLAWEILKPRRRCGCRAVRRCRGRRHARARRGPLRRCPARRRRIRRGGAGWA